MTPDYKAEKRSPLLTALLFFCMGLSLVSGLMLFVHCTDRIDEFMNGVLFQNKWVPLQGDYLQYLMMLPFALKDAVLQYPAAGLAALVFFPVLAVMIPLYDLAAQGMYDIILMAWLPLVACAMIFITVGVFTEDG